MRSVPTRLRDVSRSFALLVVPGAIPPACHGELPVASYCDVCAPAGDDDDLAVWCADLDVTCPPFHEASGWAFRDAEAWLVVEDCCRPIGLCALAHCIDRNGR